MKTKLLIVLCTFLSLSIFSQNVITQDVTIQLNTSGGATITPEQIDNGSTSTEGISSLSLNVTNFDCSNIGENEVTLTVVSNSGSSATGTAIVTVADSIVPKVKGKNTKVDLDANGIAIVDPAKVGKGSSDNCEVASITLAQTVFTCADIGKNKVTLTVTDTSGNQATKDVTITVSDKIEPTVITQDVIVEIGANGQAIITPEMVDNGSYDNCEIASYSLSRTDFSCSDLSSVAGRFSKGSFAKSTDRTVVLTVTDVNGNTNSASAKVTIQDTTGPEFLTSQPYVVYLNASGNGSFSINDFDMSTVQDYCAVKEVSFDEVNFSCDDIGFTTINVTAEDVNDNTTIGIVDIEVRDTAAPKVTTKNITVEIGANGEVVITPSMVNKKTKDNCSYILSLDKDTFTCADIGKNKVTLTATDPSGNIGSKKATVTVIDAIPLNVLVQDITVSLDENGNATISPDMIDNGTSDNCSFTMSLDKESFTCNDIGANTVNLAVTDNEGNITVANATVTVVDTISPTVVGQDISVILTASGTVGITWNDVLDNGLDNCTGIAYTISQDTFDVNDVLNSPVTIQLVGADGYGNTTSIPVNVTVIDPVPSVITQDITVALDTNGEVVITPEQIDNGSSSLVGLSGLSLDISSFNCSNLGKNEVTLTATSTLGSSASDTGTVTVVDAIAPAVVGQNISVTLTATGTVSITVNDVLNNGSDNCGAVDYTISQDTFGATDVINSPVTIQLTGTDPSGNATTVDVLVTVIEPSPVVITQDITVELDESGNGSITAGQIDNGSSSVTGISNLSLDITTFDCSSIGQNTVNLTVTSTTGNVSSATATVTVVDALAPIIETNNISVVLTAAGTVSITYQDVLSNGSDNCVNVNYSINQDTFDINDAQNSPVTIQLTGIDGSGNETVVPAEVTVIDPTPVVVTQNVTVQLDESGNVSITSDQIDNGSSSPIGLSGLSLNITSFDCSNIGESSVVLTATSTNGISASAVAIVTVEDTSPAEVLAQNIDIYIVQNQDTSITVEDIDTGSNDACGIESLSLDITTFDCENLGDNIVTLTVTDINGNVSSKQVVVTVSDTVAPTVVTKDISVELDANGNATITPEDVLILSEEDLETGETCEASAAEYHAMYLSNYKSYYYRNNEKEDDKKLEVANSTDVQSRHGRSARFVFDENGGSIIKNLDGTAVMTGTLVNRYDTNDQWIVTLNLANASNWDEWSAMGRSWKGDRWSCGDNYRDWTYYEMADGSKLTGSGSNVGKETMLSHAPSNFRYGFQLGDTANLQNANFGLSGWFYYKNYRGRWEQGDFNLDINNCETNTAPEGTIFTSDNCSITSYDLDIDSFGCDNLGENTVNVSVTDQSGNTTTEAVTVTVLGEQPTVSIPDFYAVYGQKKNTVFLGYAESVHLCPVVTGGEGFTYEWSDDSGNVFSTEQFPRVSPTITTNYTVTVTNSNGCSDSASIEVCVIDARGKDRWGNYNGTVKICHHRHSYYGGGHETTNVHSYYVRYHLWWHGDTLGACDAECVTEDGNDDDEVVPTILAYPNPSSGVFKVKLENFSNRVTVALYNIYGSLIQYRYVNCTSDVLEVTMGSRYLRQGAYIVKVTSNHRTYTQTMLIERRY